MRQELWLPVKGFEGFYEVSNMGNVRTLARTAAHRRSGYERVIYGRLLTIQKGKRGYMCAHMKVGGIRKLSSVHRLVAEAFILNPSDKPEVNHIDGNKENNCVGNLEWCTRLENVAHSIATGLKPKYTSNGKERRVIAYDMKGNFVKEFKSIREAGRELNVFGQNICSVLSGRNRYAKGYTFKRAS